MKKIIGSSRYVISATSVGAFVASILLLFVALAQLFRIVFRTIVNFPTTIVDPKALTIELVNNIDLFLLSAGFYIIGLGFYELFVDDSIPMPDWLEFHDFEDLKTSLVGIIIVVLAVAFLGRVLDWKAGTDIAALGIAVGLVIAGLTYFISVKTTRAKNRKSGAAADKENGA